MLAQLKNVTDLNLYNFGSHLLVEQAIWLALTEQIKWERVEIAKLQAEVPLALPGGEAVVTKVIFQRTYSEEGGYCSYLNLETTDGPCRNSADKKVALLAERIFGKM